MSIVPRVLLGLGGTVDFELKWDSQAVTALAQQFGITRAEIATQPTIRSQRDLLISVLNYLSESRGGERHTETAAILFEFAEHFEYETTLGGTGVRAGIALAQFGVKSLAHLTSVDDTVRAQLPSLVEWVCSAQEDTLDPHLIFQFPADATVELVDGSITTTQPSRLIYAHDVANAELILHPSTSELIKSADIFLLCGFNGIRDESILNDRIGYVARALDERLDSSFVFFEDAGYHIDSFAESVRAQVTPRVDVYSMNEDELQELLEHKVDLLDGGQVGQAIHEVHARLGSRNTVVHSRYWAIIVGEDAASLQSGVDIGVLFAATRFRVGDAFCQEEVAQTQSWPVVDLPSGFVEAVQAQTELEVAVTPGFVLDVENPTTIGLGDTFAGGFVYAMHQQRFED